MPIRLYGVSSSGVKKEEATVRIIIQQDAVGNPPAKRPQQRHVQLQERYAETSLLARRPLPSSCVELGGTSDSITNISA